MVTIPEARQLLEAYFSEHPPAITGDLYIAPEWYEDAQDYLPVWGSRQFYIDGDTSFARWDNLAVFVDRRTGAVRVELHTLNFAKISRMTPVTARA